MKRVVLAVALDVTDNATDAEVRAAVARCLAGALHIYAESATPRPHRLTGGPVNYFGSAVAAVEVQP